MLTPNQKGDRSLGIALAALVENGNTVLIPFGVCRYDLVVEEGGAFTRVQVKTGRVDNGVIVFNGYTTVAGGTRRSPYQPGEIDAYAVVVGRETYLVPSGDVGVEGRLRLEPTRNGQSAGVRFAVDYQLGMRPSG